MESKTRWSTHNPHLDCMGKDLSTITKGSEEIPLQQNQQAGFNVELEQPLLQLSSRETDSGNDVIYSQTTGSE